MNVLLTGNLSALTEELSNQLCIENKLVLVANEINEKVLPKKAISFSFALREEAFSNLFESYNFDAVVFLATRSEHENRNAGTLEELSVVLRLCYDHKVSQVVYISSSEVYMTENVTTATANNEIQSKSLDSDSYLLSLSEDLCRFYKNTIGLNVVIIHVPYVYSINISDSLLSRLIVKAKQKGTVDLPGANQQQCDFIKDEDVSRLVRKIIEEGYKLSEDVIDIGSGKPITFLELSGMLRSEFPQLKITYSTDENSVPIPVFSEIPRRYYDWIPLSELSSDFAEVVKNIEDDAAKHKPIWTLLKEKASKYKILLQGLELILGFLLMEFLNRVTGATVQFRFIDFRLLYVVIFGSVHGMRIGIIAAILACISSIISFASDGMGWQVLVYNVNNWLPFVAYLIAGAVTGYTKDKSENTKKFQKKQMESLEEHYLFLYELYDQTLKNKNQYKDQIMSYRDSFGRVYSITKKLDTVVSDAVFQEAISVLEDVLDNQTITIYTITPDKKFGRLAVSSSGFSEMAESSIQLSRLNIMMDQLTKDDVWFNRDMLKGYPTYCAPIYDEDRLVALIMIQEAAYTEMSAYYMNFIKVTSGLIQASLVRAANYSVAIEDKMYLQGTRILRNDSFSEIFSVRREMKENQLADFQLLRVNNN
ncbi:MAG: NAD-dependent epimerase/dehydratase family protein, partial [Ruminococcaceae bacterium]|nr:NAD-dependent epimerase/dehydratase family protein [Oscillospiraceae bacterium]